MTNFFLTDLNQTEIKNILSFDRTELLFSIIANDTIKMLVASSPLAYLHNITKGNITKSVPDPKIFRSKKVAYLGQN